MDMSEQPTMTEHTLVIERELDAPRELVWKVWTDPDEVTMVGPDGEEYPSNGLFGIVEPPERLSFGEETTDHPLIESGETTVEFIDLGESRTKVVITSRMVCAEELVD